MRKLLEHDKTATVIIVDWRGGSHCEYKQAIANIRVVGAVLAHVISILYEELGLNDLDKVHLIGHSLGAHSSGYAGEILQNNYNLPKIGRITGLDPAGPFFSDVGRPVRLDETDATFVDVVHSDIKPLYLKGFGMEKPIGHIDFYPNGGLQNPGCDLSLDEFMKLRDNSTSGIQKFISCDHMRSYEFFINSIKYDKNFIAIKCDSYDKFTAGECARCDDNENPCFEFGFNSYTSYKNYLKKRLVPPQNKIIKAYLLTGATKPFNSKFIFILFFYS